MQQDELREMLEELIEDKDKVSEVMELFEDMDRGQVEEILKQSDLKNIDLKLLDEADWRKRATLAAMRISQSLDN